MVRNDNYRGNCKTRSQQESVGRTSFKMLQVVYYSDQIGAKEVKSWSSPLGKQYVVLVKNRNRPPTHDVCGSSR